MPPLSETIVLICPPAKICHYTVMTLERMLKEELWKRSAFWELMPGCHHSLCIIDIPFIPFYDIQTRFCGLFEKRSHPVTKDAILSFYTHFVTFQRQQLTTKDIVKHMSLKILSLKNEDTVIEYNCHSRLCHFLSKKP